MSEKQKMQTLKRVQFLHSAISRVYYCVSYTFTDMELQLFEVYTIPNSTTLVKYASSLTILYAHNVEILDVQIPWTHHER